MMERADPAKIAAVRDYLERKFPGLTVEDHQEVKDHLVEVFTIKGGHVNQPFTLKVAHGFFDTHEVQHIEPKLEAWQVGDFLKVSGLWPILVTSQGIKPMK